MPDFLAELKSQLSNLVRHDVKLGIRRQDGSTLRQTYQFIQEKTGRIMEELTTPSYPPDAQYLLNILTELTSRRQTGPNGLQPFTWSDIKTYMELTDTSLEYWELMLISHLDTVFCNAVSDESEQES